MIHIAAKNKTLAARYVAEKGFGPEAIVVEHPLAPHLEGLEAVEVHVVGELPMNAITTLLKALNQSRKRGLRPKLIYVP